MRLTIIPADQMIGLNGTFLKLAFSAPAGIHAIQTYDSHAEVEYSDGRPNEIVGTAQLPGLIAKYLPLYEAEQARLEALKPPTPYSVWDEQKGWVIDSAAARTAKKKEIDAMRSAALAAGVAYEGQVYQADPVSYGNLTGALLAVVSGIPLPEGFCWRSASDFDVPMDAAALTALGSAMLAYVNQCYQRSWALKTAVDAAQTLDEIEAVTWE